MPTRLAVADLWPEPTHSFVEVGEITGSPLTSFLYIPIPPHTEFGTIHAQLKHLHSPVRRAISGFILRPQAEDVQALLDDQALIERIQHRLDEKPGWVLYWDGTRHNLSPLKSNSKAVTLRPKVVSEIVRVLRRAETSLLLSHPGAVLPNLAELHYEGPNGSHYASFARPGLALRRIARLDAMCFWLQHFLRQPTTVLLDSWSMLSLGLKLQLYCGKNVHHLESLLDYHESTDLILGRLAERNGQLPERILLLLSVSSTGALAKRLHDACRRDGCRDIAVVSLFAAEQFRKSAIGDVFCPLGQEFSPVSRNLCQWCLKGSSIVKIEPTTYLMEISATAKETRITKNGAKQARDFLVGYGGIDYL